MAVAEELFPGLSFSPPPFSLLLPGSQSEYLKEQDSQASDPVGLLSVWFVLGVKPKVLHLHSSLPLSRTPSPLGNGVSV